MLPPMAAPIRPSPHDKYGRCPAGTLEKALIQRPERFRRLLVGASHAYKSDPFLSFHFSNLSSIEKTITLEKTQTTEKEKTAIISSLHPFALPLTTVSSSSASSGHWTLSPSNLLLLNGLIYIPNFADLHT